MRVGHGGTSCAASRPPPRHRRQLPWRPTNPAVEASSTACDLPTIQNLRDIGVNTDLHIYVTISIDIQNALVARGLDFLATRACIFRLRILTGLLRLRLVLLPGSQGRHAAAKSISYALWSYAQ